MSASILAPRSIGGVAGEPAARARASLPWLRVCVCVRRRCGGGPRRPLTWAPVVETRQTRQRQFPLRACSTACLLRHPMVVLEAVAVPDIGIKSERLAGLDIQGSEVRARR